MLRLTAGRSAGRGKRCTALVVGSTRTIAFRPPSVIQGAPSGPTITPCGADPSPSGTSSVRPVSGSRRPNRPVACAVYQTVPSLAGATSWGWEPSGTGYSCSRTAASAAAAEGSGAARVEDGGSSADRSPPLPHAPTTRTRPMRLARYPGARRDRTILLIQATIAHRRPSGMCRNNADGAIQAGQPFEGHSFVRRLGRPNPGGGLHTYVAKRRGVPSRQRMTARSRRTSFRQTAQKRRCRKTRVSETQSVRSRACGCSGRPMGLALELLECGDHARGRAQHPA